MDNEIVNRDAEIPDGDFYVSVRDGRRFALLLGPYGDYRDAVANIRRGRDLACERDDSAWFYDYGTARVPVGTRTWALFGAET